jgi:hypothetical protein
MHPPLSRVAIVAVVVIMTKFEMMVMAQRRHVDHCTSRRQEHKLLMWSTSRRTSPLVGSFVGHAKLRNNGTSIRNLMFWNNNNIKSRRRKGKHLAVGTLTSLLGDSNNRSSNNRSSNNRSNNNRSNGRNRNHHPTNRDDSLVRNDNQSE